MRYSAFFILILTLSAGCEIKTLRNYSYLENSFEFNNGVIYLNLRGARKEIDKRLSARTAPYELSLRFVVDDVTNIKDCLVLAKSVALLNIKSGERVNISTDKVVPLRRIYDNSITAYFLYDNLNLPYDKYELSFTFSFSKNCSIEQKSTPVIVVFRQDFTVQKYTLLGELFKQ